MAKVVARVDKDTGELEAVDSLVKRFKKQVNNEGIFLDVKKHAYFKPKAIKRKEKSAAARKYKKKKVRR